MTPPHPPGVRFDRVSGRALSKVFGRHRALHRVDLDLSAGTVTAILGPNGAGKTTLLDLFSTLSRPTQGTLAFGDLPPEQAKRARGGIGLLSHAPLTYGDLTAVENVAFFARLYGSPAPQDEARALLAEFGLGDAADRLAKTFSRGMRQRLGLARALAGRPSLVLLDEPFTGLDRASTESVLDRVKTLRDDGAMILMVSHDLSTTAELADRGLVLRRGRRVGLHEGRLDRPAWGAYFAEAVAARAPAPEHPS